MTSSLCFYTTPKFETKPSLEFHHDSSADRNVKSNDKISKKLSNDETCKAHAKSSCTIAFNPKTKLSS